jgi:hypothetical protein
VDETQGILATRKFYIATMILKITVNNPRYVPASPSIMAMSAEDSRYVQGKIAVNGLVGVTS